MKRAQIWGLDVMMAMSLFLVGIVVFFTYTLNNSTEGYNEFETLSYDAKNIANNLMLEGYPENWNETNVEIIGISTNNKINQSKLEELYKIVYTNNDYEITKDLFNTRYDYYIYFDFNMTINGTSVDGIGKPGTIKDSIDSRNLIKITRFTIYENKTTPLYVITWEK